MKPGTYRLSQLLKGRVNPEDLKQFERVWCNVDEDRHWHVVNYSQKSNTYPRFRDPVTGRMVVIQRAVWEAVNERFIPVDNYLKHVCHHADCVNPKHLFLKGRNLRDKDIIRWRLEEVASKKQGKRMPRSDNKKTAHLQTNLLEQSEAYC